jgi:hypothetical protein
MIENGAGYAAGMSMQHLLRLLEKKGLLSFFETKQMLDGVSDELRELLKRGSISPEASTEAARAVDMMYLPLTEASKAAKGIVAAEDLNASNDE